MPVDIFKAFKKSIEKVKVKGQLRGTLEATEPFFEVELEAIVKRRNSTDESVNDAEVFKTNTTIHFRQSYAHYVKRGNYVQIDGEWHSIVDIKDGKDFDKGVSSFIYVAIGNDIQNGDDPDWLATVDA